MIESADPIQTRPSAASGPDLASLFGWIHFSGTLGITGQKVFQRSILYKTLLVTVYSLGVSTFTNLCADSAHGTLIMFSFLQKIDIDMPCKMPPWEII